MSLWSASIGGVSRDARGRLTHESTWFSKERMTG